MFLNFLFLHNEFILRRPEKLNDQSRKKQQLEIKRLKAELRSLVSRPVLPLQESLKYPKFETVQSYIAQCSQNKS